MNPRWDERFFFSREFNLMHKRVIRYELLLLFILEFFIMVGIIIVIIIIFIIIIPNVILLS